MFKVNVYDIIRQQNKNDFEYVINDLYKMSKF